MPNSDEKDNVISFPGSRAEYEDAAFWIVRLNRGLSDEEHVALGQWLARNTENPRILFELAEFWDELDQLSELASLFPLEPGSHAARPPARAWSAKWAWAGCLLLIICLGGIFTHDRILSGASSAINADSFEQSFMTAVGERVTEKLPDGSEVTLNTDTELRVRYGGDDRIIDLLEGEAYFSIVHDAERPFGVRVGEHIVQAVGTAFNVRIQSEGEVEVTVTEGIVQILEEVDGQDGQPRNDVTPWWKRSLGGTGLVQGQVAMLDRQDGPTVREVSSLAPVDLEVRLAWQRGILIFEGEPLETVLDEFSRYTSTAFMLGSHELADLRVGGYFRAGDIDGLLLALEDNFGIRAERISAKRILLQPAR